MREKVRDVMTNMLENVMCKKKKRKEWNI